MKFGKWHALAVGVLFLILAGLVFLTSDLRARVTGPEVVLREVLGPFQTAFSFASRSVLGAGEAISSIGRVREENRKLRQQVAALASERQTTLLLKRENAKLREMLGLKEQVSRRTEVAEVTARPAEHWFATVTINRGSRSGIEAGMPVVSPQGAVGHVENVTPNTARVILLVDSKSAIGGLVVESDTPVLVEGIGDPTGASARIVPLVRHTAIRPGDHVVTSGLSQIFPQGIPVGVVERVSQDASGLDAEGILRPNVDFDRLQWVAILFDSEGDVVWPPSAEGIYPQDSP